MEDRGPEKKRESWSGLWDKLPTWVDPFMLFLLFFTLYLSFAHRALASGLWAKWHFFDADCPRVLDDLTGDSDFHYRTAVHPLFVLLFRPVVRVLSRILEGNTSQAVATLLSAVGALNASFLHFVFTRIKGIPRPQAFGWCLLYGTSFSAMVFSSIPETFIFSNLSLSVVFACFYPRLKKARFAIWGWVLAGVFSFGMLITNGAQWALAFWFGAASNGKRFRRFFMASFAVLALSAGLSVLQKWFHPSTEYFFLPHSVLGEERYLAHGKTAVDAAKRFLDVTLSVFVTSVTSASLEFQGPPKDPNVNFGLRTLPSFTQSFPNALALVFWVGLFLQAVSRFKNTAMSTIETAAFFCVVFCCSMHFCYGWPLFLYSGGWMAPLFVWIAGSANGPSRRQTVWLYLTAVAVFMSNYSVFSDVLDFYSYVQN